MSDKYLIPDRSLGLAMVRMIAGGYLGFAALCTDVPDAKALSLTFESSVVIMDGGAGDLDGMANGEIRFDTQIQPGGHAYLASRGLLKLDVVPGVSATMTLTGVDGAPFTVVQLGNVNKTVLIKFDSMDFPAVKAPGMDSVHLDGSVGGKALFNGVTLKGEFFGSNNAAEALTVGPFAALGGFSDSKSKDEPTDVTRMIGTLTWQFDNELPSGSVTFPASASLHAVAPEPATWLLLGSGLAGLAYWRRKRRKKRTD